MSGVQVHPQGLCESEDVGDGTRVWAFAHVLPGARKRAVHQRFPAQGGLKVSS